MDTLQSQPQSWITPGDRRFARRTFSAVVAFVIVFAFFTRTWAFFEQKFYLTTGPANWIWVTTPMSLERPVAFFATREFTVPPNAQYVHLNIAADPSYTVWVNGMRIGAGSFRVARSIDAYDITTLKRAGTNRIVVACRSEKGAGGLLASVDFAPLQRNMVVTDTSWKLFEKWDPRLLVADLDGADGHVRSFGLPPVGRWNFPPRVLRKLEPAAGSEVPPLSATPFMGRLPETRILSGIAVASAKAVTATAYDFGWVEGRAVISRRSGGPEVMHVRFANAPDELSAEGEIVPVVFAAGETRVVEPLTRSFRYVVIYGRGGTATVEPVRR